jgi:hypothetical protein
MNRICAIRRLSRRFFVSSTSFAGFLLALGPVSLLSGCGDDKGPGQVETPVDPTKTQSGMDSMKAYQEQMKIQQKKR